MAHQPEVWTGDVAVFSIGDLFRTGCGLDQDFEPFCDTFPKVMGADSAAAQQGRGIRDGIYQGRTTFGFSRSWTFS
jgi:hypothetical protein